MNWPKPHLAIRTNNAVWELLYYDQLIDTPDYQITYLAEANLGFYNCAQAISRWSPSTQHSIEQFFVQKAAVPTIYLDPQSPNGLEQNLTGAGYAPSSEEKENWYGIDLSKVEPDNALHGLTVVDPQDSDAMDKFVRLDAFGNDLPPAIKAKLSRNLRGKTRPGIELTHLMIEEDHTAIACGSVGVVKDIAVFAEAATLHTHRRQGYYRRIMLARLALAKKSGARFAFFTAAADALSNQAALTLGFSLVFTREYWRKALKAP